MFSFAAPDSFTPAKCYATHGVMGHLDPKQMSSKKKGKPWGSLQSRDFIHSVDLIFPKEIHEVMMKAIETLEVPGHHRVYMSLEDILDKGIEGFFNAYVKSGSVMMLSEGRVDSGNVLQIVRGHLTMYLERETYERAGIVGKPHGVKGKRGTKPRWIVEVNLNESSMVHGKKGFEGLLYAAKNVFNKPIAWLICNLSPLTPAFDPLEKFSPIKYTSQPIVDQAIEVNMAPLKPTPDTATDRDAFDNYATETYEWLSMIRMRSPRIETKDEVDPYLSLYRAPGDDDPRVTGKAVRVSWTGFMSHVWVEKALMCALMAVGSKSWFSFTAASLSKGRAGDTSEMTVLRPPNSPQKYVLWDIKGPEVD